MWPVYLAGLIDILILLCSQSISFNSHKGWKVINVCGKRLTLSKDTVEHFWRKDAWKAFVCGNLTEMWGEKYKMSAFYRYLLVRMLSCYRYQRLFFRPLQDWSQRLSVLVSTFGLFFMGSTESYIFFVLFLSFLSCYWMFGDSSCPPWNYTTNQTILLVPKAQNSC